MYCTYKRGFRYFQKVLVYPEIIFLMRKIYTESSLVSKALVCFSRLDWKSWTYHSRLVWLTKIFHSKWSLFIFFSIWISIKTALNRKKIWWTTYMIFIMQIPLLIFTIDVCLNEKHHTYCWYFLLLLFYNLVIASFFSLRYFLDE